MNISKYEKLSSKDSFYLTLQNIYQLGLRFIDSLKRISLSVSILN